MCCLNGHQRRVARTAHKLGVAKKYISNIDVQKNNLLRFRRTGATTRVAPTGIVKLFK